MMWVGYSGNTRQNKEVSMKFWEVKLNYGGILSRVRKGEVQFGSVWEEYGKGKVWAGWGTGKDEKVWASVWERWPNDTVAPHNRLLLSIHPGIRRFCPDPDELPTLLPALAQGFCDCLRTEKEETERQTLSCLFICLKLLWMPYKKLPVAGDTGTLGWFLCWTC